MRKNKESGGRESWTTVVILSDLLRETGKTGLLLRRYDEARAKRAFEVAAGD